MFGAISLWGGEGATGRLQNGLQKQTKRKGNTVLNYDTDRLNNGPSSLALTGGIHTRLLILQNALCKVMSSTSNPRIWGATSKTRSIWMHLACFQVSENQVVTANRVLEQGQYLGFIISGSVGNASRSFTLRNAKQPIVRHGDQVWSDTLIKFTGKWNLCPGWGPHSIEWLSFIVMEHMWTQWGGCLKEGRRDKDFCRKRHVYWQNIIIWPLATLHIWGTPVNVVTRRPCATPSRIVTNCSWQMIWLEASGGWIKTQAWQKKHGKTDSRKRVFGVWSWYELVLMSFDFSDFFQLHWTFNRCIYMVSHIIVTFEALGNVLQYCMQL